MPADKGKRKRCQCDRWSLQHSALASIIIVVHLAIPTILLEISINRRYAPQLGVACYEEIYVDSIGDTMLIERSPRRLPTVDTAYLGLLNRVEKSI